MTAIQLRGLRKRFGGFEALRGIDLDVEPGEVFGFLGPNGAGKSTTIRILLDEIRASTGTATLLGLDSRRDAVVLHRRLGYLPSDLALPGKLTGRETLRFLARLRGGVAQGRIKALAERFDADLDKRTGELSTGNRQKIGLIAACMHDPELVIMDEPNTGLDPLVQHEFQRLLRELVDDGRTVLLSSHTLSEVQRVADRVGIIRAGELVAVEPVHALRAAKQVTLTLDREPDPADLFLDGVRDVEVSGPRVALGFDGELGRLLEHVARRYRIVDLAAHEADLEDVFLAWYEDPR